MATPSKIMAAIGFSEFAQGIFNCAAELALKLEAELVVGNVINSRDVEAVRAISAMGYDVDGENYVAGIRQERQQMLERIIAASPYAGRKVKALFLVGNPVQELLKMIVDEKVDMVVMGVKGRTNLENVLVGSVAEKLFRRCPVTVVSYRNEQQGKLLRQRFVDAS